MAPLALYLRQSGLRGERARTMRWRRRCARCWSPAGVAITGRAACPRPATWSCTPPPSRRAIRPGCAPPRAACRLVRRGEMLAEILRGRKLVAVVGAHGKTTTTGMLITALRRAGFPCGWLLGGLFNDEAVPPGPSGSSDWVVAEIDESDGTIDGFSPEITVMVSLDWDHPGPLPRASSSWRRRSAGWSPARAGRWCSIRPARCPCGRSRARRSAQFTFGANGRSSGASVARETDTAARAPARRRLSRAARCRSGPGAPSTPTTPPRRWPRPT